MILRKYFSIAILAMAIITCSAGTALPAGHAVILQYHFFGDEHPPSTTVSMDIFRRHLEIIRETGCNVWPLGKVAGYLREGRELPDMCVAISIDDAYRSAYTRALPMLEDFGYPAALFIPAGAVDSGLSGYMSWDQIRDAMKRGIEPASHGYRHGYMIRRLEGESEREWEKRIKGDILLSLKRLKEELNTGIDLFAYPYGEYNNRLKEMVVELGLTAFGQQSGPAGTGSDFAALPRFPVSGIFSDPESFRIKLTSLPLPVESAVPDSPVIGPDDEPPALRLELGEGDYIISTLACYVSGQGRTEVEWIDRKKRLLRVKAEKPLPAGRSRYNFTVRHSRENRYFWYSHLWIKTGRPAE